MSAGLIGIPGTGRRAAQTPEAHLCVLCCGHPPQIVPRGWTLVSPTQAKSLLGWWPSFCVKPRPLADNTTPRPPPAPSSWEPMPGPSVLEFFIAQISRLSALPLHVRPHAHQSISKVRCCLHPSDGPTQYPITEYNSEPQLTWTLPVYYALS